jgi:hypothetical protein
MRPPARWNALPDYQAFLRTVTEVHHHSVEINRTAAHPQLNRAETAVLVSHPNVVVVSPAVYVRISQVRPTAPVFLCR